MEDNSVTDFLSTISTMSKRTAKEYAKRLNSFRKFVLAYYGKHIAIDNLMVKVKEGSENPYSIENSYADAIIKGKQRLQFNTKAMDSNSKEFF